MELLAPFILIGAFGLQFYFAYKISKFIDKVNNLTTTNENSTTPSASSVANDEAVNGTSQYFNKSGKDA